MLTIEFIGGPYDGHQHSSVMSASQLPTDVVWLVCDHGLQLSDGAVQQQRSAFHSVALYGLSWENGNARYRFAGAISAKDFGESLSNFK